MSREVKGLGLEAKERIIAGFNSSDAEVGL